MNDLIRPMLYDAFHFIWPAHLDPGGRAMGQQPTGGEIVDVVGPICESGDYLAKGPPPADDGARRLARRLHRRRVWVRDEQQL